MEFNSVNIMAIEMYQKVV